jgi:hypothetical protein
LVQLNTQKQQEKSEFIPESGKNSRRIFQIDEGHKSNQTANPTIELQRATSTTQPPLMATPVDNCVACFRPLTPTEQTAFLRNVNDEFPTIDISMGFSDVIQQLCELFEMSAEDDELTQAMNLLDNVLTSSGVDPATSLRIQGCIIRAF